jgi:hypothetical protein
MKRIILTSIFCFALLGLTHAQQQADTLYLFFDIDKSAIEGDNAKLLNKLATEKNIISISIYGYADFLGSYIYNLQLSNRRSTAVHNYLIGQGVDKKVIALSKGEGIYPNSAQGHRNDLTHKGIRAHRTVRVVYQTMSPQTIITKEKLSE